jgi:hypothetical protein
MNGARGRVELPASEVRQGLRGLLRGRAEEPLDVPDVHAGSLRAHRQALVRIDDAIGRLVRSLAP